jgi:hypothetical protein
MKARTLSRWVLAALLVALLLAPGMVAAKATRTECTGTEIASGHLDPGLWTSPGGNIHVRGMVTEYLEESSCPELRGVNTVTMNANWSADFVGPMWGTSRVVGEYGVWEGTWQGKIAPDGSCSYEAISHGISGAVAGLKLSMTADCTEAVTTFTATILNPRGQ